MGDLASELFKAFVFIVVVAAVGLAVFAGGGAVGCYMLASALGAGKGLALAAGAVGALTVPVAAGGVFGGIKKWKKERERKKWQSKVPPFTQAAAPAPAPAPQPAVQPSVAPGMEDAPPVFVDALAKMKELDPEARKKYLDRLRDAFPDEVETLHKYNDGMALSHDTAPMKKITLVGKPSNTAP